MFYVYACVKEHYNNALLTELFHYTENKCIVTFHLIIMNTLKHF